MVRTYDSWSEMYYGHSWEREWTFGYIVIKACDARFDGKLPVRRLFQQVWLMYRLRNVCSNYMKTKFPFRSRIFDSVAFENPFQKAYLTNNLKSIAKTFMWNCLQVPVSDDNQCCDCNQKLSESIYNTWCCASSKNFGNPLQSSNFRNISRKFYPLTLRKRKVKVSYRGFSWGVLTIFQE